MTAFNNWSNSKNTKNANETFAGNHFHDILKHFDVLPNFILNTSKTMLDYYLQIWCMQVAS